MTDVRCGHDIDWQRKFHGLGVHSEVIDRFLEITHRDRDVVTFSEGFMQLCDVRRPVCYVRHATRDSGG